MRQNMKQKYKIEAKNDAKMRQKWKIDAKRKQS